MPAGRLVAQALRTRRFIRSHWHHLLFALGAVVVLLLGWSQWQASASLQALADLQRQAERVEHLDNLLVQLMDAENAVRGYLLSGNRAHLEPYDSTVGTVHQTLAVIRRDLAPSAENDAAVTELSGLVAVKLQSLDEAVRRGIAGQDTRPQGKRYTDRIRESILGLKARLAEEGQLSFDRSVRHMEDSRWVVLSLAAGALCLMTLLFLVLERQLLLRERLSRLLQSENQRLDALVQERTGELSDLASYLTQVREEEKERLARELHDELGALLTTAKMEAGWIARNLGSGTVVPSLQRLARLEQLLNSGIALKRRIIDDLRPPLLEMLGLVSALHALGEEFARGGGEAVTLELPADDLALAPEPALALYRIAQESLTNIRKHAGARRVTLALRRLLDSLELEVADDGRGFVTGPLPRRHHGLAGMKHRVQMCAGEFTLASRPDGGTRVLVRIPFAAAAAAGADQDGAACRT